MKTLIWNSILWSFFTLTAVSQTAASARIAVLDTGSNYVHIQGVSFTRTSPFVDSVGHGTLMTRVILDAFPEADIVMVKISDTRTQYDPHIVGRGLQWCLQNNIDIVNLSFTIEETPLIRGIINQLADNGCTVIAAVGNRSMSTGFYAASDGYIYRSSTLTGAGFPANMENVIGVGALNFWGTCASYARDEGDISVDGRASTSHGTSISSARLAGYIALILTENPSLTNRQVRNLIHQISKEKKNARLLDKDMVRTAIEKNLIASYGSSDSMQIARQ